MNQGFVQLLKYEAAVYIIGLIAAHDQRLTSPSFIAPRGEFERLAWTIRAAAVQQPGEEIG